MPNDWSRFEVEVIVADHLDMLAAELAGVPYSKTAHRLALLPKLQNRSPASVEFKHQNISAALVDLGFPHIVGYRWRENYQQVLLEVVAAQIDARPALRQLAAEDAERSMVVPEVADPLAVLHEPPKPISASPGLAETSRSAPRPHTNYLELEARNRFLGAAGERFVLTYEVERLSRPGRGDLASRVEHTSVTCGDGEGFDVRSFEVDGRDRLIEVKTTKYGIGTPFFVSRNEVETSARRASAYNLYRLYAFRSAPRMYALAGSIAERCLLSANSFLARPL